MKLLSAIVSSFLLACCHVLAQPEVDYIKKNLVEISVDPANEDYEDLVPIKKYIGDARIVMLGEQSHGDGTTFSTKVRLIKFLHEKLGFEVLAFENGFAESCLAWEKMLSGEGAEAALKQRLFSIWSATTEFAPLYPYLDLKVKTGPPLIVTGFDPQILAAPIKRRDILVEFQKYLTNKNVTLGDSAVIQNFWYNWIRLESRGPAKDSVLHRKSFPLFKKTLSTISGTHTQGEGKEDIKWNIFWNSSIAFLPGFVKRTKSLSPYHDPKINVGELRDSVMAMNLIDIASRLYPGKKIIVWAATDHISRNYKKNMGYFLEKHSTEKVYTIGFTAATGTFWNFLNGKVEMIEPFKPNSFEDLFSRAGIQNFFLDFKANAQTKKGKWLSEPRTMRPMGYVDLNKDWVKAVDAVIFNSNMEPSHVVR